MRVEAAATDTLKRGGRNALRGCGIRNGVGGLKESPVRRTAIAENAATPPAVLLSVRALACGHLSYYLHANDVVETKRSERK